MSSLAVELKKSKMDQWIDIKKKKVYMNEISEDLFHDQGVLSIDWHLNQYLSV